MPPTYSSQAAVAAAYRTLIAHETEPKEQDFYRTRLQRLEQATEPECEFDCRSRVAAAGVGVYCPQCSAKCADTDLATQLAKAIRAAWVDRLDWDELAQGALEFLSSTGRLVPASGMALTAEQVEDVRTLVNNSPMEIYDAKERGLYYAAAARLRALFPATGPAEEAVGDPLQAWKGFLKPKPIGWYRTMELDFAAEHFGFPVKPDSGDWFTASDGGKWCSESNEWELRYYPPAPAEPAEEETKAEEFCCHPKCRFTDWGGINRKHERGADCPIVPKPASSPVVPAPTETGPWQTWQEVPEGVKYWRSGWPNPTLAYWVNRGGVRFYADAAIHEPFLSDTSGDINLLAPFAAVEEG